MSTDPALRDVRRRAWSLAPVALVAVALQVPGSPAASALALAFWVVATAIVDRRALVRIWQPRLIALSAVLALLSGLLLGTPDTDVLGVRVSSAGLDAGAVMVLRALLLVGVGAAAARLMTASGAIGPGTRRAGVSATAAVAFELVPQLAARIKAARVQDRIASRGRLGAFEQAAVELVCDAARIAGGLADRGSRRTADGVPARILVGVVGPAGSGKTTALRQLVQFLAARGHRLGGVLQPASRSGPTGSTYELEDVRTGERRPFVSRDPISRQAVFDEQGWIWAADRLRAARLEADVLVVDELGLVEAKGGGHLAALLQPVPGERARVWLLAVRDGVAGRIAAQLGPLNHAVIPPFDAAFLEGAAAAVLAATSQGAAVPSGRERHEALAERPGSPEEEC